MGSPRDSHFSHRTSGSRIGIIYSYSPIAAKGRKIEKIADCEIVDVAQAIQTCLQEEGYQAEIVALDPSNLDQLFHFDWIFNLAETIYGFPLSDDQVAYELEKRNLQFTGSGSKALQACRNKAFTKESLNYNGIVTPAYEVHHPNDPIQTRLSYPLMVKPLYEDGSFGIIKNSIADHKGKLIQNVERIHTIYQQPALVEEFIDGRDITVSVLGNGEDAVTLPISEIIYTTRKGPNFMTFPGKWLVDSKEYQSSQNFTPANLDPTLAKIIGDYALDACRIMGCRDYSRVDFRLKGNTPYFLEVNPNPCINPEGSGYVVAGLAGGYSYSDLIVAILNYSMKRRSVN